MYISVCIYAYIYIESEREKKTREGTAVYKVYVWHLPLYDGTNFLVARWNKCSVLLHHYVVMRVPGFVLPRLRAIRDGYLPGHQQALPNLLMPKINTLWF